MLLHYIKNNIRPHIKHSYLFSDCYSAQNKINTILRFMLALTGSKQFEKTVFSHCHSFLLNEHIFEVTTKKVQNLPYIYVSE